jgi:hypothetical protein
MPLKIIATFWGLTLFLFYLDLYNAYGSAPNKILLFLFMVPNILILLAVQKTNFGVLPAIMPSLPNALRYFRVAFLASLLLLPLNIFFYTGSGLREFFVLFSDPLEAYSRMHQSVSGDRSERLGFLLLKLSLSWLLVGLVPLGIILHKRGQIKTATLLATLLIFFVLSVFRGTDKELADIMIFLLAGSFLASPKIAPKTKSKPLKILSRQTLVLSFGSAVFLYFFAFRKSERLTNLTVHCFQNTSVCMDIPSTEVNPVQFLIMMLYRYATHGYYGLAASFDAQYAVCPFIGDSRVMRYIFEQFGVTCSNTITEQLGNVGWTSSGAWSTGFTQLANNFGHIPVYLYILCFAISLKAFYSTYLQHSCYLSGVMYMLNFFILFYMVGNLQIQQVGEQYFGYLILNAYVFLVLISKSLKAA